MIARRLDAFAVEVRELSSRTRWTAGLALASLAAAPIAQHWSGALAAGLALGGLVEGVLALSAASRRHELVARLAAQPDAYELPEVRRYAVALTSRKSREQMAALLREVVALPPPDSRIEHEIAAHRADLLELADDLMDPGTEVAPLSAVALHTLLNDVRGSPLFDAVAPTGELHSALIRIHDGLRHRASDRPHRA